MADPVSNGTGGDQPKTGQAARPAAPAKSPAAATRRTAGPAKPGPAIIRPKAPSPSVGGAPPSPGGASAPAKRTPISPKQLRDDHELASRQLGLPELTLTEQDAQRLALTIDQLCDLTGFRPTSAGWSWLSIAYTLISIYGIRAVRAIDRVRREAAARPAPAPRPASPQPQPMKAPPAPESRVPPPPGGTLDLGGTMNGGTVTIPVAPFPPGPPSTPIVPPASGRPAINRLNLGDAQPAPGLPIITQADISGPL